LPRSIFDNTGHIVQVQLWSLHEDNFHKIQQFLKNYFEGFL
ncbi:2740_t:CDS:1, partial [Cetraspora pellucida]